MLWSNVLILSGLAASVSAAQFDPYYANLTFMPPRTLNVGSNLTVYTQTGTFIGNYNDTYPNVRQFLSIPYAQPPVGDLRWRSPQRPNVNPGRIYDSTRFGPTCAQYAPAVMSFWNEYEPTNQVSSPGENLIQGAVSWASAEDCLTLAVWTPAYANETSNLPVALFVTGGGMVTGGINIPSQLPANWVARSQEHIVVTINYRLNIFGTPTARALNGSSFQLQDVRAAVEWVYENIGAFGGDSQNIMLWGQSAGADLTHLYTLAFPDFPLVKRFGIISGPASETTNLTATPDPYQPFDIVAQGLGCDYGDDYEAQLDCMRTISWVEISEYINRYNATPSIGTFDTLYPDDIYIFSNESDRYAQGKVAPGPAIRSDVFRESPSTNDTATAIFEASSVCAAFQDAVQRKSVGLETYRYQYAGNFSNISPVPWLGAFHWTDLLMIFGTYPTDRGGNGSIPELEVQTSEAMQDFFLAFLKDPTSLPGMGWPVFDANATDGGTLLEFGNVTVVGNITGDYIDGHCLNASVPIRIDA